MEREGEREREREGERGRGRERKGEREGGWLIQFGILSIYKLLFIRAEQKKILKNIKNIYNRIKQDTTDSLQGTECWYILVINGRSFHNFAPENLKLFFKYSVLGFASFARRERGR